MRNEADFKKVFAKSVRNIKGYAMPLACPTISGIPDLYIIIPNYMPVMLEAKWLGEITNKNFNRKIPYSKLQELWLSETNKIQSGSSFGLIGFKYEKEIYCVMTNFHVTQINYSFKRMWPWVTYNKGFDVVSLFDQSTVPLMNIQPLRRLTHRPACDKENKMGTTEHTRHTDEHFLRR